MNIADYYCSKVHIKKIQKMNNFPVAYLDSFWIYNIGKKIINYDLTSHGIYEIVQDKLGIKLEKCDQIISATQADEEIACALKINLYDPLLVMQRIVTKDDQIIEVSTTRYRADKYSYRIELRSEEQGHGLIIK